ncbi:MAG: type II toxin-antitoxin system VapC family toxin [Candidatus Levybacteria bacterium]|nr:type II toxin-antitoxin system VapC family toxin [Candidatus Levybacteria bacterium]
MKKLLFVDTNFFCAIHNKTDSLHNKAQKVLPLLFSYTLATSNFVLLEAFTIILQRASRRQAMIFKEEIYQPDAYKIIWIRQEQEEEIWNIFTSITDKDFSYVDASILAVMQKEKIKHLLSFDKGFKPLQKKFSFTLIGAE